MIVPLKLIAKNLQVWFLGENANYAASEYAWESATPPGTALMMLDADKMVAAANSRNPTLAGALTRLQRCAFSGSWEVNIPCEVFPCYCLDLFMFKHTKISSHFGYCSFFPLILFITQSGPNSCCPSPYHSGSAVW